MLLSIGASHKGGGAASFLGSVTAAYTVIGCPSIFNAAFYVRGKLRGVL
jgi:hypothetical protein